MSSSQVEERQGAVVSTSHDNIEVLVVEGHCAKRGRGLESLLRRIWVIEVPDI